MFSESNPLGKASEAEAPKLLPVVSQANVKHVGDIVSIQESTQKLEELGGKWDSLEGGFVFDELGIIVGDAHEENVLRGHKGKLAFIDTEIRMTFEGKTDRLREYAGLMGLRTLLLPLTPMIHSRICGRTARLRLLLSRFSKCWVLRPVSQQSLPR